MAIRRLFLAALCFSLGLIGLSTAARALGDAAEVRLGEIYVLTLHGRLGGAGPQERARNLTRNILDLASDPTFNPDKGLVVNEGENGITIDSAKGTVLLITSEDARLEGTTKVALAARWSDDIERALKEYRAQGVQRMTGMERLGRLVTATLSAWLVSWLIRRLRGWRGWKERPVFRGAARSRRISKFAFGLLLTAFQILTLLAYLGTAIGYLIYALWLFPQTQPRAYELLFWVATPARLLGQALLDYVPNFFIIAAIVLLANFALRFLHVVFLEFEDGTLSYPGFEKDWVRPGFNFAKTLVLIASVIAIFPYIPGSDSLAFRGISLFVGFMVSVSSSASVGNLISGTLLLFSRAYSVGDKVEIGPTRGVVISRELLATKILTPTNVVVTVPSSTIIGGQILNYSTEARDRGILVTSTLTLGYDLPWRTVHSLLISAALATPEVEANPEPFVVQRQLNDFHVSYELNARTRNPMALYRLPGALNERIQDAFRDAGLEILSPTYLALRSGRETTVPPIGGEHSRPEAAANLAQQDEPAPQSNERTNS
jgi:small-conductance mechanosensitive channel